MSNTIEVQRCGQITIPEAVCNEFNIEEGQKYRLSAQEDGVLVLTPQNGESANAIRIRLREALIAAGATREGMLAELRRMRETGAE